MSGNLRLEVVTPEGKVFSSNVSELQFPTAHRGYYGVLPGHTPVVAPLGDGLVNCVLEGKKKMLTVFGGFAEIGPGHVTILAKESQTADSLDRAAITEQLQAAENAIKDAKEPEDIQKCQARIDACKIKLQALNS